MAEQQVQKKPRLWLRLLTVFLLLLGIGGTLGYLKMTQIQALSAQGSQAPPPISVTVALAEPAQWRRKIKAIGTLMPYQEVDVTTEVSGLVTGINFDSGDEVKEGQLLVQFDSRTEIANLASAQAQFESDNSQYQRLLKLKDQEFVTQNDIDVRESEANIAAAQVNVARTELSKKQVFAPFSGKLGIRRVDLGEFVSPGDSMVTLLSYDRLYLDFTLPEQNFGDLLVDQAIEFTVSAFPGKTFRARVETWSPVLDANTRNISVRALVNNKGRRLSPGMFADMAIESRRQITVITIPETSIFYNIYGEAVYVLEKPEPTDQQPLPEYRLAARQVDVAYREGGVAGVRSGLRAGDIVVTAGQLKLYPNLRVTIVDDVPDPGAAQ